MLIPQNPKLLNIIETSIEIHAFTQYYPQNPWIILATIFEEEKQGQISVFFILNINTLSFSSTLWLLFSCHCGMSCNRDEMLFFHFPHLLLLKRALFLVMLVMESWRSGNQNDRFGEMETPGTACHKSYFYSHLVPQRRILRQEIKCAQPQCTQSILARAD